MSIFFSQNDALDFLIVLDAGGGIARIRKDFPHVVRLADTHLEQNCAAPLEDQRRVADDLAIIAQPVLAAVERIFRLVMHLHVERGDVVGI